MLPGIGALSGFFSRSYSLQSYATGAWVSGATVVVNKPSGTVSGDILVAVMCALNAATVTWTGDSGWTERLDQNASPWLRVATLTAGGSEPSSYTFTGSAGTTLGIAHILCFRELQYDTIGSVATGTGDGDLAVSGITAAGGILIAAIASRNGSPATHTTPAGMTLVASTDGGSAPTLSTFYANISAGATGSRTSTIANNFDESGGVLIGLKPA